MKSAKTKQLKWTLICLLVVWHFSVSNRYRCLLSARVSHVPPCAYFDLNRKILQQVEGILKVTCPCNPFFPVIEFTNNDILNKGLVLSNELINVELPP